MCIRDRDETGRIVEFEEKPKHPKSNRASMGVYVFTWPVLKRYLTEDEKKQDSQNDFGKNIIPTMLADGRKLMAYAFEDYWKDVGTIESLWEAHMDLLGEKPVFNLDVYKRQVPSGVISCAGCRPYRCEQCRCVGSHSSYS